jgi:predicted metalloprotease with PDZ domain
MGDKASQVGRICRRDVILFRGFGGYELTARAYAKLFLFAALMMIMGPATYSLPAAGKRAHTAENAGGEVEPGIFLSVDLRDAPKHIFHAKMTIPVKAGPLTLFYPKWIQGEHSPTGPIVDLTGLRFSAAGKEIPWRRDDVDMYAFRLNVPPGADKLDVSLDYLTPAEAIGSRERPAATAQLAVLNWYLVTLYPQGTKTNDLTYVASLQLPAGWKYGTALPVTRESQGEIQFAPATLTTLIDSPVLAGAYMRTIDLSPGQKPEHFIHIAADGSAALAATPAEVQHLRQLVAETGALFGARHYRRYDFLLTLSDRMPMDGVEHHESSDNRTPEALFSDADVAETMTDLLPHEFTHSWNGKYRRPAGLVTSDYQTPLKGDLLWVYEGLTQYYGVMLAARSGFWTPERLREYLASTVATLNDEPGRTWRNLEDTAVAAQVLYNAPTAGSSWRRGVDYYDEGALIWLEADTIIHRETKGRKSLDDFCRKFHGGENTGPTVVPYTFEDVVAGMNEVMAYDWRTFFNTRLQSHGPGGPLGGLENSGWKLVFTETMNQRQRSEEITNQSVDLQFSLGFQVHVVGGDQSDKILDVVPGSPAAQAGLAPGMRLVAVNGRKWSPELLRSAIHQAKTSKQPIEVLAENEDYFQVYKIDYHGGEKYPHLVAISGKTDVLGEIARMKAAPVTMPAPN